MVLGLSGGPHSKTLLQKRGRNSVPETLRPNTQDLRPSAALRFEPWRQRYNIRVPDKDSDDSRERRHAVHASETTGLLLIALMLLVLTLVRYWHQMQWSLR